jgi:hypothetical protein
MGDDRSLNEALNTALKLEAEKAETGPTARLREVTTAPMGMRSLPVERSRERRQPQKALLQRPTKRQTMTREKS